MFLFYLLTTGLYLIGRFALAVSFVFLLMGPLSAAQAAESTIVGGACTTGWSRLDWDALFQCIGGTWKRAALMLGSSSDGCDASHAGALQWTGSAFQACNGSSWGPMGGGCATTGQLNTPSGCKTVYVSADQTGFTATPSVYCAYFTNCNTGWVRYTSGDGGRNVYVSTDTAGNVSCASRRDDGSCYQANCSSCYLSYH